MLGTAVFALGGVVLFAGVSLLQERSLSGTVTTSSDFSYFLTQEHEINRLFSLI
jgi:hypothetical protein